jgi:DNA-binding response OmpR family regulator
MKAVSRLAVVVEPEHEFAEALRETLEDYGFDVVSVLTHTEAAKALGGRHPYLLLACTPASPTDAIDAYLDEHQRAAGPIPTLIMVADCSGPPAPPARKAARLLKPFNRGELLLAVDAVLHMSERREARVP